MATHALIGVAHAQGVRYIYVESGGHPSKLGRTLLENYRTPARVNELLDKGALAFVRPTPEKSVALVPLRPAVVRSLDDTKNQKEFMFIEYFYYMNQHGDFFVSESYAKDFMLLRKRV